LLPWENIPESSLKASGAKGSLRSSLLPLNLCENPGQLLKVERIQKRIHLLHHNISIGAHAAREERRLFQDGRANLAVMIRRKHAMGFGLNLLPKACVGRQKIASPFDGANWFNPHIHSQPQPAQTVRRRNANTLKLS
jgi:hypothetical protein